MNCLRSLSYIKRVSNRYEKYGLKTIIVHPPEWDFEKDSSNILKAAKRCNIRLPIIIDKHKKIIKRLKINFWPAQILVNNDKICYRHIGEGNYKKLEKEIQKVLGIKLNKTFACEPKYSKFPAIYAGKRKNGIVKPLKQKKQNLKFGIIYEKGDWKQSNEFLSGKGYLAIKAKGKTISFVAKSLNNKAVNVNVRLNNKIIRTLPIKYPKMYEILKSENSRPKELFFEAKSKIAVYSFAFK